MKTNKNNQQEPKTNNENVRNVVNAALCLALCMVLPFLTGQIPQIGSALSPLLRFMLFGMPPLFPTGTAMAFELAAYGAAAGILYKKLPRTIPCIYISLIGAMLAGRVVWGTAMAVIAGVSQVQFSFQAFLAGAFLNAVPGIICHIILIPVIIIALQKAHFIDHEYYSSARPDTLN